MGPNPGTGVLKKNVGILDIDPEEEREGRVKTEAEIGGRHLQAQKEHQRRPATSGRGALVT